MAPDVASPLVAAPPVGAPAAVAPPVEVDVAVPPRPPTPPVAVPPAAAPVVPPAPPAPPAPAALVVVAVLPAPAPPAAAAPPATVPLVPAPPAPPAPPAAPAPPADAPPVAIPPAPPAAPSAAPLLVAVLPKPETVLPVTVPVSVLVAATDATLNESVRCTPVTGSSSAMMLGSATCADACMLVPKASAIADANMVRPMRVFFINTPVQIVDERWFMPGVSCQAGRPSANRMPDAGLAFTMPAHKKN